MKINTSPKPGENSVDLYLNKFNIHNMKMKKQEWDKLLPAKYQIELYCLKYIPPKRKKDLYFFQNKSGSFVCTQTKYLQATTYYLRLMPFKREDLRIVLPGKITKLGSHYQYESYKTDLINTDIDSLLFTAFYIEVVLSKDKKMVYKYKDSKFDIESDYGVKYKYGQPFRFTKEIRRSYEVYSEIV